jgi:poly(A) polymerase
VIGLRGFNTTKDLFRYDAAMKIVNRLREAGFDALFAGGCVRDLLMRRRPKDYDIATSARPEEVAELFDETIPIGERFGVVRVMSAGQAFEVATFRKDVEYRDGRRPEAVEFRDACEDAQRRDFTINGMFFDPVTGVLVDYVDGQNDIDEGVVRAIGDPSRRFAEDYLRMLRAVRFASTLGFRIEKDTFDAICDNASSVASISGERIRTELELMLVDSNRRHALNLLDESGLLKAVLPELHAMKGVKQSRVEHPEGDVWRHTLLAVSHLRKPSFILAMAVLLHDVGKPPTARAAERVFQNHEHVGEKLARSIAGRLRLSNAETERIAFLVRYHMTLKDAEAMRKSRLKRIISHELYEELMELHRVDAVASNGDISKYEFVRRAAEAMSAEELKPKAFLDGEDLAALGVERGPMMGRLLRALYDAQLDDEVTTRDEAFELAESLINESATG